MMLVECFAALFFGAWGLYALAKGFEVIDRIERES